MDVRYKNVRIASILGIVGNLFLLIIKAIVGIIFNSYSMIADAFNSMGDIFSSVLTYIGNRIASRKADNCHNLGHGKAEYIYSMLISIAMIYMAYKSFYGSFKSLILGRNFEFSIWLIIVCLITILVKFVLYVYTKRLYLKYNNILIKANSKDHRNDCVITLFNLLACICSIWNIYFVDSLVGIGISFWIFLTGVKIFKESYDVLMDKSIDDKTKNMVYEIIRSHPEIKRVNHFNSTPVGYRYQISVTIFVDGNMSTFESHDIADRLEDEIIENIPEIYLAVIHVNPIDIYK